jgi:hypothetical protein
MDFTEQVNLKTEIHHIFDSGANEIRIFNMVKAFIDNRKCYTESQINAAYDKGYREGVYNRPL